MNWKEVISLLKDAGYSQAQIAAACKCGQSTICEIGTGEIKDPRDSIGQALRRLAAKARRKVAARQKAAA